MGKVGEYNFSVFLRAVRPHHPNIKRGPSQCVFSRIPARRTN